MTTSDEQVSMLSFALTIRHAQLYHENAEFHQAVDVLARMLPAMVNGLAIDAAKLARARKYAMQTHATPASHTSHTYDEEEAARHANEI